MAKNLVIVESPAKAKTIEGYLGKDFLVKSSIGHIRDLPKKGGMGIDIDNGFVPKYEVSEDKKHVVAELKKNVKNAETVWIATDEDREGEAIAWHLQEVLDLEKKDTKRIVFHEITKKAITNAVQNPRDIDENLVNAQQARRVLDRLVGFKLSPVLWRKVKQGLSAGRVQSVAVRLIVEREKEIESFISVSSYRVVAIFENRDRRIFKAEIPHRFEKKEDAEEFLNKCVSAEFTISDLEKNPAKKSPSAPFTTSTLQQEASRKLGYSVSQTMSIAQRLYESGRITYMRTDSVNLSQDALESSRKEIINSYGKNYSFKRSFSNKSKSAQEAHEAIRPTDMSKHTIETESSHRKLYELIWKRTIASQMSDALLERTTVRIGVSTADENFVAKGEMIKFDGFMKVYMEDKDEESEEQKGMLPQLNINELLNLNEMSAVERFSKHPPRYAEASLVKKLEDLGIGRPSTYASIITTIQKRGYVVKETRVGIKREYKYLQLKDGNVLSEIKTENTGAEKNKMFPTDIGVVVNEFLVGHFDNILDYGFTAGVEKEFDEVAEGKKKWNEMIQNFYGDFHLKVENVIGTAQKALGERNLGVDPVSGKNVFVRIGPFGPMVQLGEKQDDENAPKPKFASLLKNQSIQSITIDEALDLFKLPRVVGSFDGEEVVASVGRFGPYLRYKGNFTSINKDDGDEPLTIKIDRAIELIKLKIQADKDRLILNFEGDPLVQVLNGRYGPFIQVSPSKGKKINVKIPKDKDPKELTREKCLDLMQNQPKSRRKKK
ncbi:MAG: DNA topoisomerase I [Flavobacteriales bacterium]|nr:DNA topoisomerase I [Flavobacteriales bacterium]